MAEVDRSDFSFTAASPSIYTGGITESQNSVEMVFCPRCGAHSGCNARSLRAPAGPASASLDQRDLQLDEPLGLVFLDEFPGRRHRSGGPVSVPPGPGRPPLSVLNIRPS
jgi:hypothetical protein